ncbi:hypothetical protein [Longimicrobium sp.]|uniref:hypothetical protein n=1 Tax=Longimicrobium sp. TaxID=2029185 RepID=UPI002BBF4435|nr:hypothetical protein [Longimicrobium sp.]HSU15524.1 hypothetical protein [Longimicrobium sp.]
MSFYDAHPARPASEMEWEDVLVRYEITPRALRAALGDGDAQGPARERLGDLLRALVANELWTAILFAAMRDRAPVSGQPRVELSSPDPAALFERFQRLRERNFAEVQRRGIGVWEWRADAPGLGPATAYQVILASAELDGRTLAEVREALRGAGAC